MMASSKLGVFANLALAASAVLLPPGMAAKEFGDDNAIATFAAEPFKRSVALDCPGCPFASLDGDKYMWTPDAGNVFQLDFEVAGDMNLELDGKQLYPPSIGNFEDEFRLIQIDPSAEEPLRLRATGYKLSYSPAETVSEEGIELFPLQFQIASIEDVPVNLPAITINLLKDTEGRLMIASFQATQSTVTSPTEGEKECNEWPLLCKWKSIVADRLEKMRKMGKGCHGRVHGHGRPNPMGEDSIESKPPHRFHPGQHHHRPHHMGHDAHRHHSHHRFHMFLRRAFATILIPILIGIFAGTLTYLVGMALGCLIAMVIAKFRGQSYERIALGDDIEDIEEPEVQGEKEDYAELPAYEAPPVYNETADKEVGESK